MTRVSRDDGRPDSSASVEARSFSSFFRDFAGVSAPHEWQDALAREPACVSRTIRVPTGFGKTLGVLSAWFYNRVERADPTWPRRLVWVLPMRVLVEQTVAEARAALARAGRSEKVGVYLLMGGADPGEWHLRPDRDAVLVGTQDMLLSRALNRGYGAARGRWPMEFGLLNHDCLWVFDEVQLMDVGLATSVQLQAYRVQDEAKGLRPCRTWWMSATLQRDWLQTPDSCDLVAKAPSLALDDEDRKGPIWEVKKPLQRHDPIDTSMWAERAVSLHCAMSRDGGRITLLVANTVDRAVELYGELGKLKAPAPRRRTARSRKGAPAEPDAPPLLDGVELCLVHSRFRPRERQSWREAFLSREACADADRIIVATQVVEAGVDISASVLMTEVAPWPSLVQRFGRVARYGGSGQVHVIQVDERRAAPYDPDELAAAWDALGRVDDVGPAALEAFEEANPELVPALYPYDPKHLLLRHELDELFDTTPDLTGADVDVSRFIRTGDERDLQVAWEDVPADARLPGPEVGRPVREALCAVPFKRAQEWIFGRTGNKLQAGRRAWVWDYLEGAWRRAERVDLYPGQVVLVSADSGGYSPERGFDGDSRERVEPVPAPSAPENRLAELQELADAAENAEDLSAYGWKTIATHGREVGQVAGRLARALALPERLAGILELAGRWHDVGKAHPAFQGSIRAPGRPARRDLAKAPDHAWPRAHLYDMSADGERRRQRRGFRHELASALALFAVLRRYDSEHPALLGPWRELLAACDLGGEPAASAAQPGPLAREILDLDAQAFDLLVYLVGAHHGKVRARLHAAPGDQAYRPSDRERAQVGGQAAMPIRGVMEGDRLPDLSLTDAGGGLHALAELTLTLAPASAGLSGVTGASWFDRVQGLLREFGPFTLAWLEALLRAADVEASRFESPDELLAGQVTT